MPDTSAPTAGPTTGLFRKRQVTVEAWRTLEPLDIETLEGTMHADPGDWIITGVKGEQYPCKPDVFAATYDPVGADDTALDPDGRLRAAYAAYDADPRVGGPDDFRAFCDALAPVLGAPLPLYD